MKHTLSVQAILKEVEALNRCIKRPGTPERIIQYLDLLDVSSLSTLPVETRTGDQFSSPFQQWCLFRARAYYVLGRYRECLDLCRMALEQGIDWIDDGEGWIRCRAALCKGKLGDPEEALWDLYRLIQMPIDLRWYVFHTLSEYVLDCDLPLRAFVYTARAALRHLPHEQLHAKWRVFWQGARVCDQFDAPHLSARHSLLAVKLRIENHRPIERELMERIDTLPDDPFAPPSATELYKLMCPVWRTIVGEKLDV